jgi:hypothetical protein
MRWMSVGAAWAALAFASSPVPAAAQALPFAGPGWELKGPKIAVEAFQGKDTLTVETGLAYRRDVRFEDGTVDFDVMLTRRRSFVYLAFRMADDREYEEVYLRPHKSGLPDALQYAPVHQGQSAWQLYHGPGATAAIGFEPGAWTHVRLVVKGRQAALFVGDMAKPALLVPRLGREPRAGYLALRAFVPPGSPGEGPVARYTNVVVHPGVAGFDFAQASVKTPAAEPNAVRAWAVSGALPFEKSAPDRLPSLPGAGAAGEFRRVEADPSGLVELHRHVRLPPDTRDGAAVARINVRAAQAGVRKLDLGFSDYAVVFLNGQPVFRGDAHYSFDEPRQEGLIGYGQAVLYLPLRAGDNDLSVLVSDGFGGWGLMGRFPDPAGLTIEAR